KRTRWASSSSKPGDWPSTANNAFWISSPPHCTNVWAWCWVRARKLSAYSATTSRTHRSKPASLIKWGQTTIYRITTDRGLTPLALLAVCLLLDCEDRGASSFARGQRNLSLCRLG